MRVICTHTGPVKAETAEAIELYAPQTEFCETLGLFGYNEVMLRNWGIDDLVVIEGDKVITADTVPTFAQCEEPWCCYSYYNFPEPYRREVVTGLGCTKYSLAFQRRFQPREWLFGDHPDWPLCIDCGGVGCWRNLDVRISTLAMRNGLRVHIHGQVEHIHDYSDNSWMKAMDFGIQFMGPFMERPEIDIERHLEHARRMGWVPNATG